MHTGEKFKPASCPLPMRSEFTSEMLTLWPHWQRGVMAVAGGFYDQPNIITEAMTFIGARIAEEKSSN